MAVCPGTLFKNVCPGIRQARLLTTDTRSRDHVSRVSTANRVGAVVTSRAIEAVDVTAVDADEAVAVAHLPNRTAALHVARKRPCLCRLALSNEQTDGQH